MASTNWGPQSTPSTDFSQSKPVTTSITTAAGVPIGLLLNLTHTEAQICMLVIEKIHASTVTT